MAAEKLTVRFCSKLSMEKGGKHVEISFPSWLDFEMANVHLVQWAMQQAEYFQNHNTHALNKI